MRDAGKQACGAVAAGMATLAVMLCATAWSAGVGGDSSAAMPAAVHVVVLSQQTWDDPAWRAVAQTLVARHSGEALVYSGTPFPEMLRTALAARMPGYVCFVAQPQEVTESFVAAAHQMLRTLDSDPYGDAVWGVVTGLTAADAQALADRAGPLVIRKALMKTGGDWLNYLYSGTYHSEQDTGTVWARAAGGTKAWEKPRFALICCGKATP